MDLVLPLAFFALQALGRKRGPRGRVTLLEDEIQELDAPRERTRRRRRKPVAPTADDADAEALADEILAEAKEGVEPLRDLESLRKLTNGAPIGKPPKRGPAAAPKRKPAPKKKTVDTDAKEAAEAARLAEAAEAAEAKEPKTKPQPKTKPKVQPKAQPKPKPKPKAQVLPAGPVLPPGYDPAAAAREAKNVARHLYNSGGGYPAYKADPRKWADKARGSYARAVVKGWQRLAGLSPDGVYGPATHNALKHYGAPLAPPSLFRKRADGTFWTDSDPRAAYVPPEQR